MLRTIGSGLTSIALVIGGCATAPTDIAFDATAGNTGPETLHSSPAKDRAVLVLAVGPISTGGLMQFQRLTEDQTDFVEKPVILGFGTWGVGDKMKRPEGDSSNLWVLDQNEINFLIKTVEPGTYVANYVSWNLSSPVSQGSAWNCLDQGAYAFDINSGEINIISSVDAFPRGTISRLSTTTTGEDILAQFEQSRENYPKLLGEPLLVKANAEVRWTEQEGGLFSGACEKAVPGSLTVSGVGLTETDKAPDAADAAAIAAALRNLEASKQKSQTPDHKNND